MKGDGEGEVSGTAQISGWATRWKVSLPRDRADRGNGAMTRMGSLGAKKVNLAEHMSSLRRWRVYQLSLTTLMLRNKEPQKLSGF